MLKSMTEKVLASAASHRFADAKPALEGKTAWKEQAMADSWFWGPEE